MFLYPLHDLQTIAMAPWNLAAKLIAQTLVHPMVPLSYTEAGKQITASALLFERNTRYYSRPRFDITKTKFRGEIVGVKETLVQTSSFFNLLHFERTSSNPTVSDHLSRDPKVLLVTPMSGHFSTLMRGTVEALLPSHSLYVVEWIDAKMVPVSRGFFDLEDQIEALMDMMEKLGPNLHVIGVSQASLSVLCATALLAQRENTDQPRSITLIGGPIDARSRAASLSEQAQTHSLSWFRQTQIQMVPTYYPGAFRMVYPGAAQLLDRMSMTLDRHITERTKYYQHLIHGDEDSADMHEKFYDEFLSVMDVPQEFYIQLVERAYQRCDLPNGSFTWRGKKVDPAAIKSTALLTVEGELDDLSPPGHTQAALDLCVNIPDNMKRAHLEIGVGHYGVFNGRKWRNNIEPMIHRFIRQHSAPNEQDNPPCEDD